MRYTILFFCFFYFINTYSQKVQNINFSLNAGGEVLDAAYLSLTNQYVVVGSFTTVNGLPKQYVAIMNPNGTLVTAPFFGTFNGVINSVEIIISGSTNLVFFGGTFTTVNGVASTGFKKYIASLDPFTDGLVTTPINWSLVVPSYDGVIDDFLTIGSDLFIAGKFNYVQSSSGSDPTAFVNLCKVNPLTNTLIQTNFNITSSSDPFNNYDIEYTLKEVEGKVALGGLQTNYAPLTIFNTNGSFIKGFGNGWDSGNGVSVRNFSQIDSLIVVEIKDGNSPYINHIFDLNTVYTPFTTTYGISPLNIPNHEIYCNFNYGASQLWTIDANYSISPSQFQLLQVDRINAIEDPINFTRDTALNVSINNVSSVFTDELWLPENSKSKNFRVARNKLFVSNKNLNISSTTKKGLEVICLAPDDLIEFHNQKRVIVAQFAPPAPKNIDSIVCSGNIKDYGFEPSKNALAYKFHLVGNGMKYAFGPAYFSAPGPTAVTTPPAPATFQSFTGDTTFTVNAFTNSKIWIQYTDEFSGGFITANAFDICNHGSDFLYSKPITQNLYLAPLPILNAPDSLALTCLVTSVNMQLTSPTPGISLTWLNNGIPTTFSNQIVTTVDVLTNSSAIFISQATETGGNQCKVKDTTLVRNIISNPEFAIDSINSSPTNLVFNCNTDTLIFAIRDTNSNQAAYGLNPIFEYYLTSDTSQTWLPAPAIITAASQQIHYRISYPENGCFIEGPPNPFVLQPNYQVTGDNLYAIEPLNTFDTLITTTNTGYISCLKDSASIQIVPSNSSSSIYWNVNGDSSLSVNGFYTFYADNEQYLDSLLNTLSDTISVIYSAYSINPNNGCRSSNLLVPVQFALKKPTIFTLADTSLNCSMDSIVLSHITTNGNEGWWLQDTDLLNDTSEFVSVFGNDTLIYRVTGNNGCVSLDTVQVIQTSELLIANQAPIWVCDKDTFDYQITAIGSETYSYTYQNQANATNNFVGVGGVDTLIYAEVTSSTGCVGFDTTQIFIPDPVGATFIAFQACGTGSMQVDSIWGGAVASSSQYEYSFNGGNFTTTNDFPVDSFANYPFVVKDTLGCYYSLTAIFQGTAFAPTVDFLASTYNQVGDTVMLVDITQFSGFDTIQWSSPNAISFIPIDNNKANILLTSIDTGWVEVICTGFKYDFITNAPAIDTCEYIFTKYIYFGEFAPTYDSTYIEKGISNLVVFPNPISSGLLTITFELGALQNYYCFLSTANGSNLQGLSQAGEANGTVTITWDVSGLASGNYSLNMISEYNAKHKTIVKQ